MLQQFFAYSMGDHKVIVLQNTFFTDLDQVLVAQILPNLQSPISRFQIPIDSDSLTGCIDLLSLVSVSRKRISEKKPVDFSVYRDQIKSGLDLLIDGF